MGSGEVLFSSEAWKHAFDINEPIYIELCHEFYTTFEFDEDVADDELMMKKAIKFRLCGKAYAMSILDFAKYLDSKNLLEGFPAQSVGSYNTDVLDSPCLLVLITGTSQSRQRGLDCALLVLVKSDDLLEQTANLFILNTLGRSVNRNMCISVTNETSFF
ncbi:hypothetical protein Tco_1305539 [Tanacetum coccineum]